MDAMRSANTSYEPVGATVPRTASRTVGRALERTVTVAAMLWTGLMGGFFFAFSVLVMPGLDATNPLVALPAMQSINGAVDSQPFEFGFFGAAALAAVALVVGVLRRDGLTSYLAMVAGAIYLVGTFLVTVVFNVPLNDDLDGYSLLDPSSIGLIEGYLRDWSRWNDVRTVSALVAFGLFAASALLPQSRTGAGPGRAAGQPMTDRTGA